jgi:serine/threonine protein kinase
MFQKAVMDFDKSEALFHEALELPPEVDRVQWLASRCRDDTRLFREISTLLDARAEMNKGGETAAAPSALAEPQIPAAQFGAYRAVSLIGRGGMSAVYLAERVDGQFEQTVALKVMASYLADQEFLKKFETERRLLAALHHNHITRLLDGGVSSAGDPYLVTEYVDGQPIDRYCDQRKLNVRARLRIFLQVCDAVDFAHRNLIVHRDLKPANILVNTEGVAKLLDFGTASLLAAKADVTVTRLRMLTPRYASPEQLRGERVTTATDVFSLGVILYELLSGAWPFGNPDSILSELSRVATDAAASGPATVISEESAGHRSMPRKQLQRMLKGDLSAIVLKALENDPARRYGSARAFAADVENFLAGRPVMARPQTVWYRGVKFMRRRWLPVSAVAVFVLGLASAAIISVHQARIARAEASKAERVNEFLNGMLASPAELSFDPQKFTVERMVEAAEERIEKGWKGDALTEATLRRSLGNSYAAMARFDRARPQLEKAYTIFQALGDEKEAMVSLFDLSVIAGLDGRSEDAVKGLEQVLRYSRRRENNLPPRVVFQAKDRLATTLWLVMNRRLPEARTLLDEAVALGNRDLSIPRTDLALAMSHRAGTLGDEGRGGEAEALYRKALAIGRQEDPGGYWQSYPLHFLSMLIARRDPPAAAELAREAYEICERALGPDNFETAAAKLFWIRARSEGRNPGDPQNSSDAAPALEAIEIVRKHYPPPSMNLWVALSSSVAILNRAGRFKDAEAEAREMLPILDANHLPENDPRRAQSLLQLGKALHGAKRDREAAEALKKSAAIYDAAGPAWARNATLARTVLSQTLPGTAPH